MAVSIYCNMKKIIYVNAVRKGEKNGGACGRLRGRLQDFLGLPYPVECRDGIFLGWPVSACTVVGTDVASFASYEKSNGVERTGAEKKRDRRLAATLRKVHQKLQKKEERQKREITRKKGTSNMTLMSEETFLFCRWRDVLFPAELLLRFYEERRSGDPFVLRSEQLIVLDGFQDREENMPFSETSQEAFPGSWAEGRGFADWNDSMTPEMTLVSQIYASYNYITIVTRRAEVWEAFADTAYEEYGISVRLVCDAAGLHFREKRTLILDLSFEMPKCWRAFPKDSVYMDLGGGDDKKRRLSVKCAQIPYLSLYNALDTAMKDTV